jgi:formate hydrogenlyase transcriptional activator
MGRGWERSILPEDLAGTVDKWRAILAAGEPGEYEARTRTANGNYRWCLTRAVPLRDDAGDIVKWYGTTTDINDRKRAEDQRAALQHELESERDRLRLLLDVQKALMANLDLRSLFRELAASLKRVIECDFIALAVPDPATGNLRNKFVDFPSSRGVITEDLMIPLNGTANGKAFRTRQLVCLEAGPGGGPDPNVYDTPEGQEFYQLVRQEGISAGYFLPLVSGDEVIAVLQLMHYSGAKLKSQEGEFLSALASQLSIAVANAMEHRAVVAKRDQLAREQVYLREEIDRSSMFEEIVGSSAPLRKVLSQVRRVAPGDSTVLILGETGTGKELIARAIHKQSKRSPGAFVRVNCAAIPQTLIASELFGHEKGAFTGAIHQRLGRFESADGGTIFLDEIGELPAETQLALLRVLQEREIERIGSNQSIPVDVRVLAATNLDLNAAVAAGTFRADLFYRLNVVPIYVPALRERRDDIPVLVEYLIEQYSKKAGKRIRSIPKATLRLFQEYDWPGNVRELQNVVERAVVLSESEIFTVDEAWLKREARRPNEIAVPFVAAIAGREKELIEAALAESRGQVGGPAGAAAKLCVPRQTLESRIASLQIDKFRFKVRYSP